MILRQANDTEDYTLKILQINLFIQIAQLSQSVYQEFTSLLTRPLKDNKPNAVSIHYRRTEIRPISVTKNSQEFYSDIIYSDEMPVRIIIALVLTSAKNGKYDENPFELNRSFFYLFFTKFIIFSSKMC